MKREQLPLYALALAVLVVGLAFAGVPVETLFVAAIVLACPLMMFVMMRGMSHGDDRERREAHHDHDDMRN